MCLFVHTKHTHTHTYGVQVNRIFSFSPIKGDTKVAQAWIKAIQEAKPLESSGTRVFMYVCVYKVAHVWIKEPGPYDRQYACMCICVCSCMCICKVCACMDQRAMPLKRQKSMHGCMRVCIYSSRIHAFGIFMNA